MKKPPNINAIGIREVVDRVAEALSAIATATACRRWHADHRLRRPDRRRRRRRTRRIYVNPQL